MMLPEISPINQANRQWLNYLYSKSPSTALDSVFFRGYHRCRQIWLHISRGKAHLGQADTIEICSGYDCYGNTVWHIVDPVTRHSFTTYSEHEARRWMANR